MMNSNGEGQYVALTGRVPVTGKIEKGDLIVIQTLKVMVWQITTQVQVE